MPSIMQISRFHRRIMDFCMSAIGTFADVILDISCLMVFRFAQKYWRFEVVNADGKSRWFWSLDAIKKKVKPERGMKVYGHTEKRTLLHTTKQGLDSYEWK
jgi:hypothetical protein